MNGTQISESLRTIEEAESLLFTDIQEYCTLAYNNREYAFTANTKNFRSLQAQAEILESKIIQGEYDEEAIQIAKNFLEDERYYFLIELNKKTKRYERSVREHIDKYSQYATALKLIQILLNLVVIIGAASLPFILNAPNLPRELATYISIGVAASAAILKFYRFHDHIKFHETAAEKMQLEYSQYSTQRGDYADLRMGVALDLFMDKIDKLRQETNELSLSLDNSSQDNMLDQSLRIGKAIHEIHHTKDTQQVNKAQ